MGQLGQILSDLKVLPKQVSQSYPGGLSDARSPVAWTQRSNQNLIWLCVDAGGASCDKCTRDLAANATMIVSILETKLYLKAEYKGCACALNCPSGRQLHCLLA